MTEAAAKVWARWERSHYLVRSVVIGLVMVAPAILLLWWAESARAGAAAKGSSDVVFPSILAEASTALLSIGLLGILYDAFLKRALMRDIQESLQINSALLGSGLTLVTLDSEELRFRDHFRDSKEIHVFPANPLIWHREMNWLITLAREKTVTVHLYLPEATKYSAWLEASDPNWAHEDAAYCEREFSEAASRWGKVNFTATGSRLERKSYEGYPRSGFIVSDEAAVVYVDDPSGDSGLPGMIHAYKGSGASSTIEWLKEALSRLNAPTVEGAQPDRRSAQQILALSNEVEGEQGKNQMPSHGEWAR